MSHAVAHIYFRTEAIQLAVVLSPLVDLVPLLCLASQNFKQLMAYNYRGEGPSIHSS